MIIVALIAGTVMLVVILVIAYFSVEDHNDDEVSGWGWRRHD